MTLPTFLGRCRASLLAAGIIKYARGQVTAAHINEYLASRWGGSF